MPQPPSANKKKNYEIQEVLGTGSFGKVMVTHVFSHLACQFFTDSVIQRATWHVERSQTGSPSTSPAASPSSKRPPVFPSRAGSTDSVSQDITREVALKAITKKRVRGNEESVWCEMRVLQGLDHPNIVRPPFFPFFSWCNLTRTCMRRHCWHSLAKKGQILRVVRVEVNVLSFFRARSRRRTL